MNRSIILATILTAASLAAAPVHASLISFTLNYSGVAAGNSAVGTGFVTFDDTVLPNPGFASGRAATVGVSAFSLTISGASSGNGTFGLGDVDNWTWSTSAALDLTTELVGQTGFDDFNWCAPASAACSASAPFGDAVFAIRTNGRTGDALVLVSMTPVPEPASLVLLGLGLAGLGWSRRNTAR